MNHERAKANRAYGNSLDGSSGEMVQEYLEHHRKPSNKDAGNIILE